MGLADDVVASHMLLKFSVAVALVGVRVIPSSALTGCHARVSMHRISKIVDFLIFRFFLFDDIPSYVVPLFFG